MSERVAAVSECPRCPVCESVGAVDMLAIPNERYQCGLCSFRFGPSEVDA